ncbi:MAG: hypothetical protein VB024_12090 [Dysgonamonadaceae bacterium]|nr:hypothetical protein [Dysgonamonadaceae bacterium]
MQEEKRVPIHEKIWEDTINEFKSQENQSYNSVQVAVESEYRRRVKAYMGEDVPAFTDEGEYITTHQKENRDKFLNKMRSNGRLPKTDK